jgi:hypothetical protein
LYNGYQRLESTDPSGSSVRIAGHQIQAFVSLAMNNIETTVFFKRWWPLWILCVFFLSLPASPIEDIYN